MSWGDKMQEQRPSHLASGGNGNGHNKLSVLLVDNDLAFLRIAASLLETRLTDQVNVVGTASSGEDCLVQAQQLVPDLVLMDLQMPGMGGLRTIPLLHVLFPQTRVIALTFDDGERMRQAVLAAGGNDLVSKNTLKTDLVPAIEWALKEKSTGSPCHRLPLVAF